MDDNLGSNFELNFSPSFVPFADSAPITPPPIFPFIHCNPIPLPSLHFLYLLSAHWPFANSHFSRNGRPIFAGRGQKLGQFGGEGGLLPSPIHSSPPSPKYRPFPSKMANRNLPFSINSLLTDHPPPQSPALQKAADLAECFPLIFGNSVNLPFGLAQLLGKKENEEEEEEEEEKMEMMKKEEEEEEGRGGIVDEAKEKASPLLRGANLPEQPIDSIQFAHPPPNGWLFPFSRAPLANGPPPMPMPPSNHPFPRFPFLPPSFGSALAKSSLFPLFSPFPGICTGPSLPGHHQPPQNQHKRKGGQIRFSNEQTDTLENTFDNKKYLNNSERKRLAKSLGLSERQVKTWFQNRRAKWRRQAPADSDDLRSPEEEGVHAAEQQIHLAGTALATRPSAFFAAFPGLSD